MFPHLKLLCLLFMGPTLGFDSKQRNSFLIKFAVFYNKSKILTILFIVKCEKITLFDEFLVLLGPTISRFFACSNEENNKQKQQRVLPLVLSLWSKIPLGNANNQQNIFINFHQDFVASMQSKNVNICNLKSGFLHFPVLHG